MYLNVPLCIKLQTFWQFLCEIWNILIFKTLLTVQNSEEIRKGSIILQKVFFLKLFREHRLCIENICNEQKESFNVRQGKMEGTWIRANFSSKS